MGARLLSSSISRVTAVSRHAVASAGRAKVSAGCAKVSAGCARAISGYAMTISSRAMAGACTALLVVAAVAEGQADVSLEFGGSQVGPPVGVEGDNARYLMAGVRSSLLNDAGSGIFASVLFGKTLDGMVSGSFLTGMLEAVATDRWSASTSASFDVRGVAYGTQQPFPYRAFAAEGGPSLKVRMTNFGATLRGTAGVGLSQLELFRDRDGPSRVFENDLWRYGTTGEVTLGPITSNVGVNAGWHRTPAGRYTSVGASFGVAGRWGIAEVRVDRWNTPTATETTGGIVILLPIGKLWSLRGFYGRTDPDPLTLAQPGSGGGGFLVGRSVLNTGTPAVSSLGAWEVVQYGEATSRVRFAVTPPEPATRVQLLGDFTLWEAREMTQDGDRWTVEIVVPAGTHHFGFQVDDEWYVPTDIPDVAPDEWGRLTATLVIEGEVR